MKRLTALSGILLFMLASCSSDGDGTKPNIANSDILLKKTITTFNDGSSVTANYTYQDKDLMKIVYSDGRTADYIYEGENLIKVREFHNEELYKTETFDYSGNKITKATTAFTGEETSFQFLFEHNNNEIEFTKYIKNSSGFYELSSTSDMKMNSINIAEITEYTLQTNTILNVYTFGYDVKNNPFRNISANKALVIARQQGGVNNPISFIRTGPGASRTVTTSYTYNGDNFPVTSTATNQNGEVTTTEYFYE